MVVKTFRKVLDRLVDKYGRINLYEVDHKGNMRKA